MPHPPADPHTAANELIDSLGCCGIDTVFGNPGTTEMPLVAALDSAERPVRAVLGLHESVCSAAADGFWRAARRPAATLLHLGPGLSNSAANLHNARRARSGVVNLVGDHPASHLGADAPLQTKLETLSDVLSEWTGISGDPHGQARMARLAANKAWSGQVATLIVPHDVQAVHTVRGANNSPWAVPSRPLSVSIDSAARLLKSAKRPAILVGGSALSARGLMAADALSKAAGATFLVETFFACMARGGGLPSPDRLPYFPEDAVAMLAEHDLILLAGADEPVAFFKYSGSPSLLAAPTATIATLATPVEDATQALVDMLKATYRQETSEVPHGFVDRPSAAIADGTLDAQSICNVIASAVLENGIVIDEGITSSLGFFAASSNARRFEHMCLTGGAIGWGHGAALGAALGAPGRSVINIQADGSGLYLPQALWSQARHGLPIVTVVCSNRRYRILEIELMRAGNVAPGANAAAMCDLSGIDWGALAGGFGVASSKAKTTLELSAALSAALNRGGPHLIEAELL